MPILTHYDPLSSNWNVDIVCPFIAYLILRQHASYPNAVAILPPPICWDCVHKSETWNRTQPGMKLSSKRVRIGTLAGLFLFIEVFATPCMLWCGGLHNSVTGVSRSRKALDVGQLLWLRYIPMYWVLLYWLVSFVIYCTPLFVFSFIVLAWLFRSLWCLFVHLFIVLLK